MTPIEHLPYAEQLSVRLSEERTIHDETLARVIDVEKENEALRQLVKDLMTWTAEGFLLLSDAQKQSWEQRYKELQQQVKDILGEKAL